ncbi:hypothetical protein AAWM_03407 [Aspergillus awamori]|uniref:Bacteriophage T5 Orf172 DNA-binding domain-containing protein n=2 Tax=Aspergillus TaxID=5052 RepID=A0A401KMN6_ASPAW|nr:hypothetical protein AAWM_03407 [Aspergillus awamori]
MGSLNPFRLTMWQLLRVHPLDLQVPGIGALLYNLQRGGNPAEEWQSDEANQKSNHLRRLMAGSPSSPPRSREAPRFSGGPVGDAISPGVNDVFQDAVEEQVQSPAEDDKPGVTTEAILSSMHNIIRGSYNENNKGYAYVYRDSKDECQRFKIGSTDRPEVRKKELDKQCKYVDWELVQDPKLPIWEYKRLERLAHSELQNLRCNFICPGDGIKHREYFYGSNATASEVLGRWSRWLVEHEPYDEKSKLKPFWSERLEWFTANKTASFYFNCKKAECSRRDSSHAACQECLRIGWKVWTEPTTLDKSMSDEHPNGFGQPFFIVTWAEFGLAIIFMIARGVAASKLIHNVTMDCYLAIVTFVLGAASMAMITVGATYGLGLPQDMLSFNQSKMALLYGWVNQLIALVAIGLGKLTIVAFLEQVQGYQTKARSIFLWSVAGSNLVLNCIAAILMMLQCSPRRMLWEAYAKGSCPYRGRIQIFGYIQGPWSAFCDFALALYPVSFLARVHAFSIATRIGLCVLMGFGVVAGACAIVKTVQLTVLTKIHDPSQQIGTVIVWNQTEMWVVFIVSCIPPTKVFFKHIYRRSSIRLGSFVDQMRPREQEIKPNESFQSS